MKRALFPDGVEVHQTALATNTNGLAFNIQRRAVDLTRAGKAYGFDITIGSPASRLNVSSGWGYTPRGDYVEHPGASGLALRDYNDGAVNFICVVYYESPSAPQAHESDGTTQNTIATPSATIKVFSEDEYEGLPVADDDDFVDALERADLTTDVQDRVLILARVLGKDFTSTTPNSYSGTAPSLGAATADFVNGNIVYQRAVNRILTATRPETQIISGLNLLSIAEVSPLGDDGVLRLTVTGSTKTLAWAAPGEDISSASEGESIDNALAIVEQTLEGIDVTNTISVEVIPSLLPTANGTYEEAITVEDLYDDVGPTSSANDWALRSKKGRYIQRDDNAGGVGWANLSENTTVVPRSLVIGTELQDSEEETLFPRITTHVTDGGGDSERTLLWEMTTTTVATRFYRTPSTDTLEIVSNAQWDGTQWVKDEANDASVFAISPGGIGFSTHEGSTLTFASSAWASAWTSGVFDLSGIPQGLLRFAGYQAATTAESTRPRIQTQFNANNTRTLLWRADASAGTGGSTRFYVRSNVLEITYNAAWDGTQWVQDLADEASKITIGDGGFAVRRQDLATATWNDSAWAQLNLATDLDGVYTNMPLVLDNNQLLDKDIARLYSTNTLDTSGSGGERICLRQFTNSSTAFSWREYIFANNVGSRFERTLGCHWDADAGLWRPDNNTAGSASIWIEGSDIHAKYTKNSPFPSGWADDDWDACNEAFGTITVQDDSGTAAVFIQNGFNYTASFVDNNNMLILFTTPMATSNYSVVVSSAQADGSVGFRPVAELTTSFRIVIYDEAAQESFLGANLTTVHFHVKHR